MSIPRLRVLLDFYLKIFGGSPIKRGTYFFKQTKVFEDLVRIFRIEDLKFEIQNLIY